MNKNKYILILSLTIFFIYCSPVKKIAKEPINEKEPDYLFEQLKKNEFKYQTLALKANVNARLFKNNISVNVTIRIKKDSLIWMSVTPLLGIEMFRILITNDSVKFINKMNSTYFLDDFKQINNILQTDIDFDMLQSLITGNDFSYYENNKFKASVNNKKYVLQTISRRKIKKFVNNNENLRLVKQDIWLDAENFKIIKTIIKDIKEKRKIETQYSDFKALGNQLFANKINFKLTADKAAEVLIEYEKVTADNPIEFPFTISPKYEKIKFN